MWRLVAAVLAFDFERVAREHPLRVLAVVVMVGAVWGLSLPWLLWLFGVWPRPEFTGP